MSLHFYLQKKDIPEGMEYVLNNSFFFLPSVLEDTPEVRDVLREVENAEYTSPTFFTSHTFNLGAVNISCLSTGTKTVLNIINHPDKCFDIRECGANAQTAILKLNRGHVLLEGLPMEWLGDDIPIDVVLLGKHYTDVTELLNEINYFDPDYD